MSAIHPTLRNLVTDERGNVLMTFGLTTLIAVAAVGGAIDYGRATKEKDRLQAALDAAVVGGMTKYRESNNMDEAKNRATSLFAAQFQSAVVQNANGTLTAGSNSPLVTFTTTGGQISASATMQTTTPFIQLVTGSHLKIGGSSTADLSGETLTSTTQKMVEVGIMVDLTGSMGATVNGSTKIAALKLAGADLINILLPSSGANDAAVRVGIAPFADYVNAGEYASAVTGLAATGGTYTNITNLAWTKNGTFNGTYQGVTANATGSQAGSTPPTTGSSSGGSGSTAGNGATYNNAYCSNPTQTTTTTVTTTKNTTTFGTADIGTSSNYGADGLGQHALLLPERQHLVLCELCRLRQRQPPVWLPLLPERQQRHLEAVRQLRVLQRPHPQHDVADDHVSRDGLRKYDHDHHDGRRTEQADLVRH